MIEALTGTFRREHQRHINRIGIASGHRGTGICRCLPRGTTRGGGFRIRGCGRVVFCGAFFVDLLDRFHRHRNHTDIRHIKRDVARLGLDEATRQPVAVHEVHDVRARDIRECDGPQEEYCEVSCHAASDSERGCGTFHDMRFRVKYVATGSASQQPARHV